MVTKQAEGNEHLGGGWGDGGHSLYFVVVGTPIFARDCETERDVGHIA